MRNNKNKGFTLIELLIVIAIIGILAAVLIPNLLSARTRAYDTTTQTALRELATAQEMNYIDNATYAAANADAFAVFTDISQPDNVSAVIKSGDVSTYCIEATHSASGTKTFKVTPDGGIEEASC